MTPSPPDDVLSVPALGFEPVRLCLDDALPVSLVLLLGYDHRLDPRALHEALATALRAFPHLTGRLNLELQPLRAEIVPGDRAVQLEWIRAGEALPEPATPRVLETLDAETLFARYAPSAAAAARAPLMALQAPLIQLRLTWLPGQGGREACVLGVMASHMALDGVGLALFLEHLTAALRGGEAPPVVHDRRATFPADLPETHRDGSLPPHYREVPQLSLAMAQASDPLAGSPPTVFSLPVDSLAPHLDGDASLAGARLFLAARLCDAVASLQPARRTLALWCNARGLGRVPRHYTGNAGCYVHTPLAPGDPGATLRHLRRAVTREGFAAIADTFLRLKAAEAAGRYAFWDGPGEGLLSLNIVPHARGAADFGRGGPAYAQLLTRNVSGLRLYASTDGRRLVVEASLPAAQGAALHAACADLGIPVEPWHGAPAPRSPA